MCWFFCSFSLRCIRRQPLAPWRSTDSLGARQPEDQFLLAVRVIALTKDGIANLRRVRKQTCIWILQEGFRTIAELRNHSKRIYITDQVSWVGQQGLLQFGLLQLTLELKRAWNKLEFPRTIEENNVHEGRGKSGKKMKKIVFPVLCRF